jgi:tetratricopeptide (TPR) repeat protein
MLALEPFESKLIAFALDIEQYLADRCLGELVNYGIVSRPNTCYQIVHILMHAYAQMRLYLDQQALTRLARYYISFACEQSDLGMEGHSCLDLHRAHILAIQSFCLAKCDWEAVRLLTSAIVPHLNFQCHWTELASAVENGIKAAKSDGSRSDEAAFLSVLGSTKTVLGEIDEAIEKSYEALLIAMDIEDHKLQVSALCQLAFEEFSKSNYKKAIGYCTRARNIAESYGNKPGEAESLNRLGTAYRNVGDARSSINCQSRHLEIIQEFIDYQRLHQEIVDMDLLWRKGVACGNLGLFYNDLGDLENAEMYHKKQLRIARDIGDKKGEGAALTNLCRTYIDMGDIDSAFIVLGGIYYNSYFV